MKYVFRIADKNANVKLVTSLFTGEKRTYHTQAYGSTWVFVEASTTTTRKLKNGAPPKKINLEMPIDAFRFFKQRLGRVGSPYVEVACVSECEPFYMTFEPGDCLMEEVLTPLEVACELTGPVSLAEPRPEVSANSLASFGLDLDCDTPILEALYWHLPKASNDPLRDAIRECLEQGLNPLEEGWERIRTVLRKCSMHEAFPLDVLKDDLDDEISDWLETKPITDAEGKEPAWVANHRDSDEGEGGDPEGGESEEIDDDSWW